MSYLSKKVQWSFSLYGPPTLRVGDTAVVGHIKSLVFNAEGSEITGKITFAVPRWKCNLTSEDIVLLSSIGIELHFSEES